MRFYKKVVVVELAIYKRFTEETERVEFELKEIKESEGVK